MKAKIHMGFFNYFGDEKEDEVTTDGRVGPELDDVFLETSIKSLLADREKLELKPGLNLESFGGMFFGASFGNDVLITVKEMTEPQKEQVREAMKRKQGELRRNEEANKYLDPSQNPFIKTNSES